MADEELEEAEQPEETSDIRKMRDAITRLEKENNSLKRTGAMATAGVDLESKAGQFFAQHYDGKLDPEVIKASAEEVGVLKVEAPEPEPEPTATDDEKAQTRERETLAMGAAPDAGITEDPREAAKKLAEKVRDEGGTLDKVMGTHFAALVKAGNEGDRRVMVTKSPPVQ